MPSRLAFALAALVTAALGAGAARAEEAKLSPGSLLFDISAPRIEQRALAFDEALRDPGPAPLAPDGLQADGSIRYGDASVSISVRKPCPLSDPGMMMYDVPPGPRRHAR